MRSVIKIQLGQRKLGLKVLDIFRRIVTSDMAYFLRIFFSLLSKPFFLWKHVSTTISMSIALPLHLLRRRTTALPSRLMSLNLPSVSYIVDLTLLFCLSPCVLMSEYFSPFFPRSRLVMETRLIVIELVVVKYCLHVDDDEQFDAIYRAYLGILLAVQCRPFHPLYP